MKRVTFFIAAIIIITTIFAFSNKISTVEIRKSPIEYPCKEIYNLLIKNEEAEQMKENFINFYKSKVETTHGNKRLVSQVWIDAAVLKGFGDFFIADIDNKFDGAFLFSGAYSDTETSTLVLVPTNSVSGGKHTSNWDIYIPVIANKLEFKNFNMEKNAASILLKTFKQEYRQQEDLDNIYSFAKNPGLSTSVWIDKSIFKCLRDTINSATGHNFDGIRVYLAAYNSLEYKHKTQQEYAKQSTILLVLTKKGDTEQSHIDDTNAFEDYHKSKDFSDKYKALNHGQLCPNQCD